jgi:predicted dehydrogenase/threonine dehydrogenase-like Zn-dependent dehydrogenase
LKQILQNLKNGTTVLVDVPCPQIKPEHNLIKTSTSLVSVGTERMLVEFGKAGFIEKAKQQPDKVRMVLDKIKTDGFLPTLEAVQAKLGQALPMGYCNAGKIIKAITSKSGPQSLSVGDRVLSNGNHAEIVCVPYNLCAKIPDGVSDEAACFTVIGAIGLQGIRLAQPTIGESFVVTGLGLVGLMTVQLLLAHGCRVLGVDFDSRKCQLAEQFGAETVDLSKGGDAIVAAEAFSHGRGVDGVLICASAKSSEPVHQAATMCRKRGRIILVGVVGLELSRADFFEKEISFQVSCSYGPGRYDPFYEEKGHDYPFGYVRWTEQRNFETVLNLMASGKLDVNPLISHRYSIDEALEAYKQLDNKKALGIILSYDHGNISKDVAQRSVTLQTETNYTANDAVCGFIGAGNYASRVLIPAFKEGGAKLHTIITSGGVSAVHHGKKNGFSIASTDINTAYENKAINTVVIATRHNQHARQVCDALSAGKHVFVEKPLALNHAELDAIEKAYCAHNGSCSLMVGYNRRFAPHVIKMKQLLEQVRSPKVFIMTMNAGNIPAEHWTQDFEVGGGRIIGEACHYIDLMRCLAGSSISNYTATMLGVAPGIDIREDKATITLTFEDGSFGTIHYLANGGKAFPKERIEVFANDSVLQLDNFRKLTGFGWKNFKKEGLFRQDKGQKACVKAFVDGISSGKPSPIPFEELIEVSRITVRVAESLRGQ